MKLQSVLYPTEDICNEEALYLHRDGSLLSFDGYFNLFYLEKHHKYCDIESLTLELAVRGIKKIQIMHNRDVVDDIVIAAPLLSGMDRLKGVRPATISDIRRISVALPYHKYDRGVLWFRAEIEDCCEDWSVRGYFCADNDKAIVNSDSAENAVEITVDICTYKREKYVSQNIRTLIEWIDEVDIDGFKPEVADHLHIFIVDNAKTLMFNEDFREIASDKCGDGRDALISVIPNENTGGAGGFTRGMEVAIEERDSLGLTHILLMDDDAVFAPDLFVRLYGILKTLKPQYKDLTIGGALWRQDYPFIQYASGEWYDHMDITTYSPSLDLRSFEACTETEMCSTDNEYKRYSGWWCCCYSLNTVKADNLPMKQMFIHMDDIEYEKRNRQNGNPVAFFNGIGVWHKPFDTEFLGVKTYYNTRNSLILSSKLEPELNHHYIKKRMCRMLIGNCLDNRYLKMHLIYMGIQDFLKGREWFDSLNTEEYHQYLSKYVRTWQERMLIEDLDDPRICSYKEEISKFQSGPIPLDEVLSIYQKSEIHLSFSKKITLNGKLLPSKKGVAIVFPYDRLWKKGYRLSRYAFVQRDPDKVYYVKNSLTERMSLLGMLIMIAFKFKKSSLEFSKKP
ncbi:MAG: glycosyltransferase family 2 protein [Butyrivibrio sp.]|nr:glycosyltransferase family 2 protein [Butyrivibrio sp.]